MVKKTILIFWTLFIAACNREPVFQFDSIIHYTLRNEEEEEKQDSFSGLVYGENLPNTSVEEIEKDIDPIKWDKKLIPSEQIKDISAVYTNKFYFDFTEQRCLPIYRDILVFKFKNKTTGISKICFDCDIAITVNNNRADINVDQDEIKKLKTLIK